MANPSSSTPALRLRAVATAAVVLALIGVVVAVAVLGGGLRSLLPGAADCSVTGGEVRVELHTDVAERVATTSARATRRGSSPAQRRTALADDLGSPGDEEVRAVAAALSGRSPHALTCTHGGADDEESDRLSAAGLTIRAERVRRDLRRALGPQRVGGFAPGGVSSGHQAGSAHYRGRAIDIFFRPVDAPRRQRGWAAAHYLVAHAERLSVETVIFDGRIWTARRSIQGWRTYEVDTAGRSASTAAVLEHRDHVHADVAD